MKTSRLATPSVLALLALFGCERQGPVVASAAGQDLSVTQVVTLLAGEELPNQPDVVRTLAELWVDYTLLAEAAAEDTTFAHLDIEPIIRQQLEQDVVLALRDSVVRPDTAISDEDLRRRFASEAPETRVRAGHILLAFPDQASEAKRVEVRARADDLRQRVLSGEDFAALAREHSQDRGSAEGGGDLGFFGRDQMVRPFEEAAFALEPGEVSDVVESPYGLHIIRVEEKETPALDEVMPQFRATLQQERLQAAESAFVAGIEQEAGVEVVGGAAELVRSLTEDPAAQLSGRARNRELVRFQGGSVIVGELQNFMQTRTPQFRQQLREASDEVLEENFLRGLAQRELLLAEADSRDIRFSQETADSLSLQVRNGIKEGARQLGLLVVEPDAGETHVQAIARTVEQMLRDMVEGTRDVLPLGAFSYVFREQYRGQVYLTGVDQAVAQIGEIRGPEPVPTTTPPPSPDPAGTSPGGQAPPEVAPGAPPPGGDR